MLMNALANLQKRNNVLKSKLLHDRLKYGTYQFNALKKELLMVLNAYKLHKSLIKAAKTVGIDEYLAIEWFIEGQLGNPKFRGFYLGINRMNGFKPQTHYDIITDVEEIKKEFDISQIGNSWIYTTYVDGEKISIISGDLDQLRQKVKSRNLPLE